MFVDMHLLSPTVHIGLIKLLVQLMKVCMVQLRGNVASLATYTLATRMLDTLHSITVEG